MATHVAILLRPYLKMILDGRKTIESRLTVRPLPPYRRIAPGDTIYFKASAGPYLARAQAGRVEFFEGLTAAQVRHIHRQHNHAICGTPEFWRRKENSRYGTLVWLTNIRATHHGPVLAASCGPAWFVLAGEGFCVKLTCGAIRHRYVALPAAVAARLRGREITLRLPDGRQVVTTTVSSRWRWRGWGPYFTRHHARAGSRVRFALAQHATYQVSFQD